MKPTAVLVLAWLALPLTSFAQGVPPKPTPSPQATTSSPPAQTAEPGPAALMFTNNLSLVYRLERVRLLVDGTIYFEGDSAFVSTIPPGQHALELVADYRLQDRVLTYLRGYAIELRSSYITKPTAGRGLVVQAVAVPVGGVTTPFEERSAIRWRDLPP